MLTGQFAIANHSNSFLLVFGIFLVTLLVLVVFTLRWAIRENRVRRERFNAGVRSKDQG